MLLLLPASAGAQTNSAGAQTISLTEAEVIARISPSHPRVRAINAPVEVARATKQEMRDVYAELKANLLAGATLMPTGIFATLMAQDAGCSFFKST